MHIEIETLRTTSEDSAKSEKYSGEKHVNHVSEHSAKSEKCSGETHVNHHVQTDGRNMAVKGAAGEGSERDEEYVTGNQRKGDPCYILAKSLVKLCPKIV